MDDGLIQVLVVGAFVVLSMIEAAGRKRKGSAKGEVAHTRLVRPEYTEAFGTTDGDDEDDLADWEEVAEFAEAGPGGFETPKLVPDEVWDEIAQLARGEEREPPLSVPHPSSESPMIEEWSSAETMVRYPVVRSDDTPVVRSTREVVRPHDDEPPHEHEIAPDVWRRGGGLAAQGTAGGVRPHKSARAWLGTGGRTSLRRAIVLNEIFGPPKSLKDSQGLIG